MEIEEKQFAEIILQKGLVPLAKLRRFLAMVEEFRAIGVNTSLGELLVARGLLTGEQVQKVEAQVNRDLNRSQKDTESHTSTTLSMVGYSQKSSADLIEDAEKYGISVDLITEENAEYPTLLEEAEMEGEMTPKTPGAPPSSPPPEKKSSKGFGRYKLLGEIGRGGMATVYEVWDEQLRRTVAMKVLTLSKRIKGHTMERFVSEAQATAQLQHPNIVSVHDIGETPQGVPYFTMDIVKGHSLEEIISHMALGDPDFQRVYPSIRLLNILLKICEGVAFAHSRGVIHRDLKPQNIMVGPFGEVYLMDWGLAKFLQGSPSGVWTDRQDASWVTQHGSLVGTPAYMAPEQARGEISKIDERTDVYALGAMLYELLTYRPPFVGETLEDTYHMVANQAPPPPSSVAIGDDPPTELCAIALKALQKKRKHRYQSVGEMKNDLQAYLDGRELAAMNYTWKQRAIRKAHEKRWELVGGLVAILFFLLVWSVFFSSPSLDPTSMKVRERAARAWSLGMIGDDEGAQQLFTESLDLAKSKEGRGWVLRQRGRYEMARGDCQKALQHLDKAREMSPSGWRDQFVRYQIAIYLGQKQGAQKHLETIVEQLEKKENGKKSPYYTYARGTLLLLGEKDLEKARRFLEDTLDSPRFHHPSWAQVGLAQTYLELADSGRVGKAKRRNFLNRAKQWLDAAQERGTNDPIVALAMSRYYLIRYRMSSPQSSLRNQFYQSAKHYLDELVKKQVKNGYIHYLRGNLFQTGGLSHLARQEYNKAKNYLDKGSPLHKEVIERLRSLRK